MVERVSQANPAHKHLVLRKRAIFELSKIKADCRSTTRSSVKGGYY